jgi:hypothetical protein
MFKVRLGRFTGMCFDMQNRSRTRNIKLERQVGYSRYHFEINRANPTLNFER